MGSTVPPTHVSQRGGGFFLQPFMAFYLAINHSSRQSIDETVSKERPPESSSQAAFPVVNILPPHAYLNVPCHTSLSEPHSYRALPWHAQRRLHCVGCWAPSSLEIFRNRSKPLIIRPKPVLWAAADDSLPAKL